MKLLEVTGYNENIPKMTIVVEKITAVLVYYEDLSKTAIWVDGIEDPFVSSECYSDVLAKLRAC